ncbi:ATP-binding protein [Bacteroidota bacterium]
MKIAIASGKGGTGKTTLSTNLASYLAERSEVVLTDLDVEEPNSGLFIKGDLLISEDKFTYIPEWNMENCTLCGNCQEVCNFNAIIKLNSQIIVFPELCHSCYACPELCPSSSLTMVPKKMGELKLYKNAFMSFVEGRLNVGQERAIPLISQIKEYVDKQFPQNIIKLFDVSPGTSCPVIEAIKNVDLVILVTEPTPFGLHDLKLAIEMVRILKRKFAVVINRYGIGNDDVLNYCKKEKIEIIAKIPNDRRIAELYSRGELVSKRNSKLAEQLEKIRIYIFDLMNGFIE